MTPRLLELYRKEVIPKLSEEFGYKNVHQVPTLSKIVVNIGLGEAAANPKLLEKAGKEPGPTRRGEGAAGVATEVLGATAIGHVRDRGDRREGSRAGRSRDRCGR